MLVSTLLLMVPMALCAPIQQWSVKNKYDDAKISISTINLMIHDDIQGYYENILDEVISTHNEDVLVQLAHSMNDQHSLERLLQPQAIAILHHPVQETCLTRMPGLIAQHLHHLHTKLLDRIEPTIDTLLKSHSLLLTEQQEHDDLPARHQQDMDMMEKLTLLNKAVDQHVMQIFNQARLEHKLALDLSACEIQQNQLASSTPASSHPVPLPQNRSLWLLLKNLWKKAAEAASSRRPGRMMAELGDHDCNKNIVLDNLVTVVDGEYQERERDSLFIPGPSLLQTHLNTIAGSLHSEFKTRLADLHTMLRSDVFDEEIV
ncbi:unnamed protein product [Absidia cylindrospora]